MAIKSIPAGHDQAEKKLPSTVESVKRKGRKQKKKMRETFKCYIYRVLKQVHPDLGISIKAIGIVDCFVNDVFDKLVGEAIELSAHSKKTTITARDIQTSTFPENSPSMPVVKVSRLLLYLARNNSTSTSASLCLGCLGCYQI